MKLKTLKDLNTTENLENVECVELWEIKAEVIKWVKSYSRNGEYDNMFLEFHNITKEDLK